MTVGLYFGDHNWYTSNRGFLWFRMLVQEHCAGDDEVVEMAEMVEITHGVDLESLYEKNPELAKRLKSAFVEVATEIIAGEHENPAPLFGPGEEMSARTKSHFAEMIDLLNRCPF